MRYLHLGKGSVVRSDEIVGIFDLDITSQSHLTRKFLAACGEGRRGRSGAAEDLPKSFVVCEGGGQAPPHPQPDEHRHAPEKREEWRSDMDLPKRNLRLHTVIQQTGAYLSHLYKESFSGDLGGVAPPKLNECVAKHRGKGSNENCLKAIHILP